MDTEASGVAPQPLVRAARFSLGIVGLVLAAMPAHAVVTFDSQLRDVTAFTSISLPTGDPIFCTDPNINRFIFNKITRIC